MARLGAIFFILIGFCVNALAADDSITILGVTLPGANSSKAIAQLQTLADNWSLTGTTTTVTLANGGIPVPAVSAPTSGSE